MKAYEWTFVILWLAMSAHQVSGDTVVLLQRPEPGSLARGNWFWATYSERSLGWLRSGRSTVNYHVCDIAFNNVNNWLYSKGDSFRLPNNVKKVNIAVNYTISRRCAAEDDPRVKSCKERFDVYAYQATNVPNKSHINPKNGWYRKISTVTLPSNLSNVTAIPWSVANLPLFIEKGTSKVFLAIRDQGTCGIINSVLVTYRFCPEKTLTDSLIVLGQTMAPTNESQIVKVTGRCTDNSESTSQELDAICESSGEWVRADNATGVCYCKPGWEKVAAKCQECPIGYFKDKLGNAKCSKCPLNSVTETVDRKYCKCRLGYFRAPWKKISDNCTVTTRINASGDLKVFLKVLSDTSIRVSWKIKSKNGIIQAYYVTYTLVDDPEDTNTIRTTKTTVVVTGLKPGKKYRFVVVAENSVGRISSPASIARTTNKNGDKAVDGSKDTIYIAVSTVLGIALLIALLLLGFYVNRYRIARNTLMRTMDKLQAVEEEIDMDVVEETRVDELQALGV